MEKQTVSGGLQSEGTSRTVSFSLIPGSIQTDTVGDACLWMSLIIGS